MLNDRFQAFAVFVERDMLLPSGQASVIGAKEDRLCITLLDAQAFGGWVRTIKETFAWEGIGINRGRARMAFCVV